MGKGPEYFSKDKQIANGHMNVQHHTFKKM